MALFNKKILLSNAPLKVISLIFGYCLWTIISQHHTSTQWVKVPLAFYAQHEMQEISAPEIIEVALKAKKSDLRTIDINALAAHIDASKLHDGKNYITINAATMFLPTSFTVIHYKPANIIINVQKRILTPLLEDIQTLC